MRRDILGQVRAADLLFALEQELDVEREPALLRAERLQRLRHDVDRPLVIGAAAAADDLTVDCQLERGSEPLAERAGRLHVVVTVHQDGRRARRPEPLAAHHRMARGVLDPAGRVTQLPGQPPRRVQHRLGIGIAADARHGDELAELAQVPGVVGGEGEPARGTAARRTAGRGTAGHWNALPPSIAMTCPVTQPDRSAAKNCTPFAMSAGSPSRRVAMPSRSSRCPAAP